MSYIEIGGIANI